MHTYKSQEIISSLEKKGFKKMNVHHRKYFLFVGDKKTPIKTYVSHGKKTEYDVHLLGEMRKQLKFENKVQLDKFLQCPMTYKQYISYLRQNGHI